MDRRMTILGKGEVVNKWFLILVFLFGMAAEATEFVDPATRFRISNLAIADAQREASQADGGICRFRTSDVISFKGTPAERQIYKEAFGIQFNASLRMNKDFARVCIPH